MPTIANFLIFIRNVMGINTTVLPDASPSIAYAFNIAMAICNPLFANIYTPSGSFTLYELAVYNLGGSNLINFAPDQAGQTYFTDLRTTLDIAGFKAGVVASAADQGTSDALTVPKALEALTLADLQYLKDPYGRQYLALAQKFGTLWGLT